MWLFATFLVGCGKICWAGWDSRLAVGDHVNADFNVEVPTAPPDFNGLGAL